jgi:hypothetical protein
MMHAYDVSDVIVSCPSHTDKDKIDCSIVVNMLSLQLQVKPEDTLIHTRSISEGLFFLTF